MKQKLRKQFHLPSYKKTKIPRNKARKLQKTTFASLTMLKPLTVQIATHTVENS